MAFKKMALPLASLCFSFFLSTQVNAGGVLYSNEGDAVMTPNDITPMAMLLKKNTESTMRLIKDPVVFGPYCIVWYEIGQEKQKCW